MFFSLVFVKAFLKRSEGTSAHFRPPSWLVHLLNVSADPAEHGLAIEAYGVKQVVNRGKPETVEFKADKAGIFPITCHLHPAHVGTQLIVEEK